MKRYILIYILLLLASIIYSKEEFLYPSDFYITDTLKGYNILLGSRSDLLFKFYGIPDLEKELFSFEEPSYSIRLAEYDGFSIVYLFPQNRITQIWITGERFCLKSGISIGSMRKEVEAVYSPLLKEGDNNSLYWDGRKPELTTRGEKIYYYFTFRDDILIEIMINIESTV